MVLPFTHEQFIGVFAAYNDATWPAQWLAYALALGMLWAVVDARRRWPWLAGAGLALMWLFTGIVYHAMFFSAVNPAARFFAAFFVLQGLLLSWATARGRLAFKWAPGPMAWLGAGLVVYAMAAYPLLGWLAGLRYPGAPAFGIAPCPVTLFTFGLLLLARPPVPWWLLVVPVLWSLVGGSAALLLHVLQDWLLLVSGLCVVPIALRDIAHRRLAATGGASATLRPGAQAG